MLSCNVPSARFAAVIALLLFFRSNLSFGQPQPPQTASASKVPPATAASPQSPTPAPPAVFKSTAALVLVDVLVSNGQDAIHGIPRQQFRLLEDGKEQKLIALEEHKAIDPASVQKQPELPPNIYSNIPEAPLSGAVNVLLLDALNTPIADQAYARQQMISYLKNIPPGTRIAIFTLASRLRMVQGFTSDSTPLLAALNSKTDIGKTTLPNQSALLADPYDTTATDTSDTLAQMGATSDALSSIQQFMADEAAFQMDLRVRYTLDAFQELSRYLRGVPGRKNLIWFSGSFPVSLDPDVTLQSPFEAMRTYAPDVSETTSMLAASRVAVYPVDARGLFTDSQLSAQASGSGMTGTGKSSGSLMGSGSGSRRGSRGSGSLGGTASAPRITQNSTKFFQQTSAEHATMQQIAEETGGHAYYDTNGIKEAVAAAIQNGANYYTLAYIPENKGDDGRFHKIQVSVPDAPSYKLTFRRGYIAESPKKQPSNTPVSSVVAAMLRGAPAFSEIVFKLRVLPFDDPLLKGATAQSGTAGDLSPKVKGPVERYALDYAADMHNASITETPDGLNHALLEFVAIAYDRDGARLNFIDKSFTVNLTEDQYKQVMQKGLQIHQQIDLPAGEVYLRAAVHDLTSDRIGSVEVPLLVKPPQAKK
jgi:VWFA-related protein